MKTGNLARVVVGAVVLWGSLGIAGAEETLAEGVWKWTYELPNGQKGAPWLQLRQDGEKVTGIYESRGQAAEVNEGTVKDGVLSFSVDRERDGNEYSVKYSGKIEGDELVGNVTVKFGEDERTMDWVAKRATTIATASGVWGWTVSWGDRSFSPVLALEQRADVVTGTLKFGERETAISEGILKGETVSFKVVRERDGNTRTTTFSGGLSGDAIQGEMTFERDGEERSRDWKAERGAEEKETEEQVSEE
ncbi:MAG: hypothetical protein P8J87_03100 [Verrucomicrobiales bacterium]|nr:hypothetical protein [Verrucomicrobiales bacterium]